MCGDHDGTELVAQEKSGTGTTCLARVTLYVCLGLLMPLFSPLRI